jgi:hypothetical protein
MNRVATLATVLILLAIPFSLLAQERVVPKRLVSVKRVLGEGERVRVVYQVTAEDGVAVAEGTLLGDNTPAFLTIETERMDTLSVPLEEIRGLDIQSGTKRSALQGSIVGAVTGGVLLYALGTWAYDDLGCATGGPGCPGTASGQMVIGLESESSCTGKAGGTFLGAFLGGAVGAAIGWGIKTPTWEKVNLDDISVFVPPAGGVGLGVSIGLGLN